MVRDDWTNCPRCDFPAAYSSFIQHVTATETCPMCSEKVVSGEVKLNLDPSKYLKPEPEPEAEKK
jgi:WD repeat-containing protein 19